MLPMREAPGSVPRNDPVQIVPREFKRRLLEGFERRAKTSFREKVPDPVSSTINLPCMPCGQPTFTLVLEAQVSEMGEHAAQRSAENLHKPRKRLVDLRDYTDEKTHGADERDRDERYLRQARKKQENQLMEFYLFWRCRPLMVLFLICHGTGKDTAEQHVCRRPAQIFRLPETLYKGSAKRREL